VRKNFDLTLLGHEVDITTYDTFPTVCAILGIKPDKRLDGRFVSQAFENQELMVSKYEPKMQPATKPTTMP
jgi:arylsulfatase A-like enzyme